MKIEPVYAISGCTNLLVPSTKQMAGRLLIVDDEPGLAKVLIVIAKQLGLEARAVNDPLEALAAFRDFKPDITMINMVMPGRDGIDCMFEKRRLVAVQA